MQAIFLVIFNCIMALTQSRTPSQQNFVFWDYFPFLQPQQVPMMQQANVPVIRKVKMPYQIPYPSFEMFFNGPMPINNNMPMIGELQYDVPVPSIPKTTQKPTTTTRRPRPSVTGPTKRQTLVKSTTPPTVRVTEELKSKLSKGIFEMARNIQANILSKDNNHQPTGKFNVFSPINVAAVLSLLELGARGQTNLEMQHILGFDKLHPTPESPSRLECHHALGQMFESILHPVTSNAEASQINMANGIFMQTGYSMRPDYRTSVEAIYQSQVTALDFEQQPALAAKFINDWVRQQTNGKIENILPDGIESTTRMMVASAVHFKALWESAFIPAATARRAFYPNGRQEQKIFVETMGNGGEFKYYHSKEYDCGIMALPFKGETTKMYIILPNKSSSEKLKKLQATLTSDIIEDMISKMQVRTSLITMPKMHLSDTINLKDILDQLSAGSAFESATSDFSGITEHNQVSLDGFMHKIDLTINETGTEGAAATISSISREDFEVEFRVDSPFMFFVRHELTKLPIFYGSVIEPVNSF